jgi:hypothetical protein
MTFSAWHIVLTAALTAVVALIVGMSRLPRERWLDTIAAAVLAGAAVALWRLSANMPQLNDDGLPSFSANDWAAPAMTYLFLSGYADARAARRPPIPPVPDSGHAGRPRRQRHHHLNTRAIVGFR